MQKYLALLIVSLSFFSESFGQNTRYLIRFRDKATVPFSIANPAQYLSARAIAKRQLYNIAIDSLDLPITPRYIDSVRNAGLVTIINSSKWLNQIAIRTSDAAALAKINALPFVIAATPIAAKNAEGFVTQQKFATDVSEMERAAYNYGRSNGQVKIHNADFLHDLGFRGQGMQMAVLDGGFFRYNALAVFDSARLNGQFLGTYDFVANDASVAEDDAHGMTCLSTIAANLPGQFVGTAPKLSFYLYRTEDVASEYPIEEQNWVAGIERADSLGVEMSTTSLGYTTFDNPIFNHSYADMNGNTTIAARAADIAARKGMLVVVAAGNEGNSAWRFISTPADGDSVMAVGAVDTLKNVASFSSYGPSSDGQIKPNVAAVGLRAVVANTSTGTPTFSNGTSFACPNMAGVSACLWQAFPELNNIAILNALQSSATKFTNPDDRVGYGIPDVKKAFYTIEKQLYSQEASITDCSASLKFALKTSADVKLLVERSLAGTAGYVLIDSTTAAANFEKRSYSFTDLLPADFVGTVKYRASLKVMNELPVYLDSISLIKSVACSVSQAILTIAPNPVVNVLTVSIQQPVSSSISLQLVNAAGQTVYQKQYTQVSAVMQQQIPMQNLSKALYYISLYNGKKKIKTLQVLKQ